MIAAAKSVSHYQGIINLVITGSRVSGAPPGVATAAATSPPPNVAGVRGPGGGRLMLDPSWRYVGIVRDGSIDIVPISARSQRPAADLGSAAASDTTRVVLDLSVKHSGARRVVQHSVDNDFDPEDPLGADQ